MGIIYKFQKNILKLIWWRKPNIYAKWLGVRIGKDVRLINHQNWGTEPYLIEIGDRTEISFGCTFLTHDGATWVFRDRPDLKEKNIMKFGTISIGKNCFIGCHSIIMPNVHIGNNVIVGAGSLISKNIPDNEVWAGVPAKYICTLEEYIDKCIKNNMTFDMEEFCKDKKAELVKAYGIK